jgi:3-hydroxyacyl-CoA dehydrogenase/enoyl-CoA hydratase/3-hydroxybutyryl-CoA epimerase
MADPRSWSIEIDADNVAWLTVDMPGASANVLSSTVLRDLDARIDELIGAKPAGLVIRSAKKGGFIAGADIKEFTKVRTPDDALALIRAGQAVLQRLEDLPFRSVAAIHGYALGGGLELALACSYRIGADDGSLSLGLPEVQLGIHPGFGGTVRAVRLIGVRPALDLMLKGKPYRGPQALAVGLVDELAPPAQLKERAKALLLKSPPRRTAPFVDKLLNMSALRPFVARQATAALQGKVRREHYPAPYAIVDLWQTHGAVGRASYEAEAVSISDLMCTPTSRNLVRVFMLQDRMKALGGRSPVEFRRVHVVGAGVMGGDIAAWCAFRGLEVTLQDRSEELVRPALDRARGFFGKRIKDPAAAAAAADRLRMDVGGTGVADADVVIEAIVESLEAKRSLYAQLEPRMKPAALLATNTSSIRIEALAEHLASPNRLVGVHFFNPVSQLQLVEVIEGAATDKETVQNALRFTRKLDKLPLPCKSAPGFVVNRILSPYVNEALYALESGVPAPVIDRVAENFGMPMGPIELTDVVGLDVSLHVGRVLAEAFHRRVPEILARMVEQKKLGRKSGEGFYVWRDGKAVKNEPRDSPTPADLEDRMILPMLNEAVATLREGVVADADILDAGAIFATGFAPFRGGPLQYARSRGVADVIARLAELTERYGERFRPDPGWQLLAS